VPALAVALCLIWPRLLDRTITMVAWMLKRPVAPLPPGLTRRALAVEIAAWVVSGAHLWAITVALGAAPGRAATVAIGAFALATVVGGLSVLTPDGWGVRELPSPRWWRRSCRGARPERRHRQPAHLRARRSLHFTHRARCEDGPGRASSVNLTRPDDARRFGVGQCSLYRRYVSKGQVSLMILRLRS
jgi:hypothetical protein